MKKENSAIVITCIIAVVILVVAIFAITRFSSVNPSTGKSVTVEGVATLKALPDVISVYFSIETKGKTSAEAKDANTKIYDDLVEGITIAGFNESELKTESFNVYPNTYWDAPSGKQKTDGFIATHSLKLELSSDQSDKLSDAIDAGVTAGAGISYINFELSQKAQNDYKAQALKLASEDATVKANAIASGFGKQVGKLLSVQVNSFNYYPWNVYTAMDSSGRAPGDITLAKEAAMNINPSEQDVSASITATFKLG
jgi:uncharacterized protein YggE